MKKVLVVDDEKSFLRSLTDGLNAYSGDFNVINAENGKQAVNVLKSDKIELVVTDLKMPEMDGLKLLAYMTKHHPTIPVIVMTAYGTPKIEHTIQKLGAAQYMEKPLDFDVLVDEIFEKLAPSSKRYIQGITLSSFLQLVEIEKKTCTLKIASHGKVGKLYFIKGELIDADTEFIRGDEAAQSIMGWDNTEVEINYGCKVKKKNVTSSLLNIMMTALKHKSEKGSDTAEVLEEDSTLDKLEDTFMSFNDSEGEEDIKNEIVTFQENESGNEKDNSEEVAMHNESASAEIQKSEEVEPLHEYEEGEDSEKEKEYSIDIPLKNHQDSENQDKESPTFEEPNKEVAMVGFKETLQEFTELQGVNAVCLVGRDGFVIDSVSKSGIDTEMVGAIASSGFGASESMGKQLQKGSMAMSMLEFDSGLVMIAPIGVDAFLVVDASQDANLGMVRFMIKKQKSKIETVVTAATF